jgi:hypothetical protein
VNESAPASVVEAMKSVSFDAMGSSRTLWDFYFGFGVSIGIYLFAQAAVLWFLATLGHIDPTSVRSFIAVLLVAYAANVYVTWRFFFVIPLVLSIAMVICLALALIALKPRVGA